MTTSAPHILLDGLIFPEAPRWRNDRLWFSDIFGHKVKTVDLAGRSETVLEIEGWPCGLGFLADGSLLISSTNDARVLRKAGNGPELFADLGAFVEFIPDALVINDLIADEQGWAYVGGASKRMGDQALPANIFLVESGREPRIVANSAIGPNGMAITPDRRRLVVAETPARRLSAFAIQPDGSLGERELFADLDCTPDGICLDAEGAVWVAGLRNEVFLRVREGGEVVQRIETPGKLALACTLGGEDRRTLFLVTCQRYGDVRRGEARGWIETVQVDVPGAGWP
jgi:sugar lactone lactonase YvrE